MVFGQNISFEICKLDNTYYFTSHKILTWANHVIPKVSVFYFYFISLVFLLGPVPEFILEGSSY